MMVKYSAGLKKNCLQFFSKSGFLSVITPKPKSGNRQDYFRLGCNGGPLFHNLLSEWFRSNVGMRENVSLVSSGTFNNNKPRATLTTDLKGFFPETLVLQGDKLPFGLASFGKCFDGSFTKKANDKSLPFELKRPKEFTECVLQYFVHEALVTEYFHRLEVDRLIWWKKLSNTKEFSSRQAEGNNSRSSIIYSYDGCDLEVESLEITGPHDDLPQSPYIVESKMVADLGLLAILCDAYFQEETPFGVEEGVRFHQALAPYKLGILFDGSNIQELTEIANYIKQELKKEAISIQTDYSGSKTNSLHRTGVPYSVILTDQTLSDGFAWFHDLSAATEEAVHVIHLREKIMQYVKS